MGESRAPPAAGQAGWAGMGSHDYSTSGLFSVPFSPSHQDPK